MSFLFIVIFTLIILFLAGFACFLVLFALTLMYGIKKFVRNYFLKYFFKFYQYILKTSFLRYTFRETNEKRFLEQIHKNKNSIYGKQYSFNKINTIDEFRRVCPLTDYKTLKEHLNERYSLFKEKKIRDHGLYKLICSGGTSSNIQKLLPMSKQNAFDSVQISDSFYDNAAFRKVEFKPFQVKPLSNSEYGIQKGVLTQIIANEKKAQFMDYWNNSYPYIINKSNNYLWWAYLFCLYNSQSIESIYVFSPSIIFQFLAMIKNNWEEYIEAIRFKKIPNRIKESENIDVYNSIIKHLQRKKKLADFLESKYSNKRNDENLILDKILIKVEVFRCMASGTFSKYLTTVRKHFNKAKIISLGYFSSESLIGLTYNDRNEYLLNCKYGFFEFIPENDKNLGDFKTHKMYELKKGHNYEVIISNSFCGLYRYRMNDIVQIVDFLNDAPILKFIRRKSDFMNISNEKVDQKTISDIIKRIFIDEEFLYIFGVFTNDETRSMNYNLFISMIEPTVNYFVDKDTSKVIIRGKNVEEIAEDLNNELLIHVLSYKRYFEKGSLKKLMLYFEKPGTFDKINRKRNEVVQNQFIKPINITKDKDLLKILDDNVIDSSFKPLLN